MASNSKYVTTKRSVKICTAEKSWFKSTFVLTKLVPQNAIVPIASKCQRARPREAFAKESRALIGAGFINRKDRKTFYSKCKRPAHTRASLLFKTAISYLVFEAFFFVFLADFLAAAFALIAFWTSFCIAIETLFRLVLKVFNMLNIHFS